MRQVTKRFCKVDDLHSYIYLRYLGRCLKRRYSDCHIWGKFKNPHYPTAYLPPPRLSLSMHNIVVRCSIVAVDP